MIHAIKRRSSAREDTTRIAPRAVHTPPLMRLVHDSSGLRIQAKLAMSRPGDALEQEADRVADGIGGAVTPSAPAVQRKCDCGGTCGECGDDKALQRKAEQGATRSAAAPASVHTALASSGHPLDAGTRTFMESRIGHDFSSVRVHADAQAGRSAREIGALAYTSGRDIVFAPGRFAPHTAAGRHLLAHELAHVAQQSGGEQKIQRKTEDKTPCSVHAYDNSKPKDRAVVPYFGDDLAVTSVDDLVSKVNAFVDDPENKCKCVNRLEINGHGTDGYQSVGNGDTYVNDDKALVHDSTEEHLKKMAKIKFCDRGLLMLLGCHVGRGNGKVLLQRLSAILPGKMIGGAQHYTGGRGKGDKDVIGEGDELGLGGNMPVFGKDSFLKSRFVRWHLTLGDKEYIINGDDMDPPQAEAKMKAAKKVKLVRPDGTEEIIKK